jgi:hypothetical protein
LSALQQQDADIVLLRVVVLHLRVMMLRLLLKVVGGRKLLLLLMDTVMLLVGGLELSLVVFLSSSDMERASERLSRRSHKMSQAAVVQSGRATEMHLTACSSRLSSLVACSNMA